MAEKKRIAFLCHPYHRGGVTRWMADAAAFAVKDGAEVYFVTVEPEQAFHSSGGREPMLELINQHKNAIRVVSAKVDFNFEFGTANHRSATYTKLILDDVPPGTAIIVSDDLAVWAAAAALADRFPMVGVLHGDQDYYYSKAQLYHRLLQVCVCVSGRIRKNLFEKIPGIDKGKVHVIPCGINLPGVLPPVKINDSIRLIFVGRLSDYEKRAYDLVEICAALYQQDFPFHLDIVGSSDESEAEFTDKFKAKGVGNFITFHGWQPAVEVQRLLTSSDILLLTSNSEGMPLVMMEALACGCGFTGTRVSGIEDYEHDERATDCLSVYAVGDIGDAIDKIRKVAAVPVEVRRKAARELAEAEFSMQVCINKYFQAIAAMPAVSIEPAMIKYAFVDGVYSRILALTRYLRVSLRK